MFKSIFTKYFTAMTLIIIISFTAMGGIQMLFNSRFWVDTKQDDLTKNSQYLNTNVLRVIQPNQGGNGYDILMTNILSDRLNDAADLSGTLMFLCTNDGEILWTSRSSQALLANKTVPESLRQSIDAEAFDDSAPQQVYWEVGKLGDLYTARYYTLAQPLIFDGHKLGYVFTSTSATEQGDYLRQNFQMFFLSAIGVLALAFIVIYLLTYTMVRPLRQMASATRRFGQGDFSSRITVHGRDEIAELASAFNSMAVSLSSVETMRRSFVANVSHELKTPMTTISGFIDGILDGTIPAERRDHYLKIVTTEVKRLSRLVKTMLDLSRIDNGEMKTNLTRFDLTEQTCNILLSFEQRIDQKGITIAGLEDCPPTEVLADFDLISQVVYNLLDNAVKFVDQGGTLTIRLYHTQGRTYFSARNTGVGIASTEMPHIFERFYKTDSSRSLDKNGVGLGLYIVKTIITLHNGEIVVRSAEGEFCEFEFWLPDADAYLTPPSR